MAPVKPIMSVMIRKHIESTNFDELLLNIFSICVRSVGTLYRYRVPRIDASILNVEMHCKLNGGQGRNRTGVDGFAGRSMTTLPPSPGLVPERDF